MPHIDTDRILVDDTIMYFIDLLQNGWSALHWAADRNRKEVVQILLDAGIDYMLKGRVRTSPLRAAFPEINILSTLINPFTLKSSS